MLPNAKRAKVASTEDPPSVLPLLADFLDTVRSGLSTAPAVTVEFGMLLSPNGARAVSSCTRAAPCLGNKLGEVAFVPGMSARCWRKAMGVVERKLQKSEGGKRWEQKRVKTRCELSERDCGRERRRCSLIDDRRVQERRKLVAGELLLALPGELYDVRVTAAVWENMEDASTIDDSDSWQQCGISSACTYMPALDWRIACSHVTGLTNPEGSRFEFQLHWSERATARWLSRTCTSSKAAAAQLDWLLTAILPAPHAVTRHQIGLCTQTTRSRVARQDNTPPTSHPDTFAVASTFNMCVASTARCPSTPTEILQNEQYPGIAPVLARRQWLSLELNAEWQVCVIPDGVSCCLLICAAADGTSTAVLVDTALNVVHAPGTAVFAACFPVGTILDGTVVENRSWKRQVFMVSDVRCWGDQPFENSGFHSRLRQLETVVMKAYNSHVDRKMPPMPLVKCKWRPHHEIADMVSKIAIEIDGRACYKEGASRHHACLGLWLMRSSQGDSLLPDKLAVFDKGQLQLRCVLRCHQEQQLQAVCQGPSEFGLDITQQLDLGRVERARLLGDLQLQKQAEAVCQFDPLTGLWRCTVLPPPMHDENVNVMRHNSTAALGLVSYLADGLCRDSVVKLFKTSRKKK